MRQPTLALAPLCAVSCTNNQGGVSDRATGANAGELTASGRDTGHGNDDRMLQVRLREGRHIFRFDIFGDEGYWGGTVDDSFTPGIGHRLDGWPNRDLNVGAITSTCSLLLHLRSHRKTCTSCGRWRAFGGCRRDGKA